MTDKNNDLEQIEKKYGHLVVVAGCLILLLLVVVLAFVSHRFNQRLLSDFWPIDKSSVAPNILASIIIFDVVTLAAALFYPPVRKALDRALTLHKNDLKVHMTEGFRAVHDRFDDHDVRLSEHQRMLTHVIENSHMPPLPERPDSP